MKKAFIVRMADIHDSLEEHALVFPEKMSALRWSEEYNFWVDHGDEENLRLFLSRGWAWARSGDLEYGRWRYPHHWAVVLREVSDERTGNREDL